MVVVVVHLRSHKTFREGISVWSRAVTARKCTSITCCTCRVVAVLLIKAVAFWSSRCRFRRLCESSLRSLRTAGREDKRHVPLTSFHDATLRLSIYWRCLGGKTTFSLTLSSIGRTVIATLSLSHKQNAVVSLRACSFGMIRISISDPRSFGSW